MMDVDAYIDRYSGDTKLRRLVFIAQNSADQDLHKHVSSLAEQYLKADGNTKKYKELIKQKHARDPTSNQQNPGSGRWPKGFVNIQEDPNWVEQTDAANKQARIVLQGRLSAAQSNLNKESVRTAYVALAQHSAKTGESLDALSLFLRATDYCTTRQQTASLSLSILELALNSDSYDHVREYVKKVEHTLGYIHDTQTETASGGDAASATNGSGGTFSQHISTKLKIASSLERLAQGDFAGAAKTFFDLLTTSSSEQWKWSSVICAEDVALYTAVLCLATQDRRKIVELSEHPEALELAPAMKDVLVNFTRANYKQCCDSFKPEEGAMKLMFANGMTPAVDLYLAKHWDKLCSMVREKCIIEYLKPFQRVQLSRMQSDFSIQDLEGFLADLIGRGLVPGAHLDLRDGILVKTFEKERDASERTTQENLAATETRIVDDTLALIVRLACAENNVGVFDGTSRGRSRDYQADPGSHYLRGDDSGDEGDSDAPMLDAQRNPEDVY